MGKKRGQVPTAAIEISVLVVLIGLFMIGYIIMLPPEERASLLDEDGTTAGTDDEVVGASTLLSESPGVVTTAKSSSADRKLGPIRLYSTTEQNTETLATSLTVSRSVIQNNYKTITFDVDNLNELESLALLFFISESKGDMIIELNENLVYEGVITSNSLPLPLPTIGLKEEGNVLKLSTDKPGVNIFSSHYYLLQDLKLVEDYMVADTVSTRTFSLDRPEDITSVTLNYFITCNSDDEGVLSVSLNNREMFSDRVFCEYLNERELGLDADYLQNTNTLKFEISKGDYNVEEMELDIKSKTKEFPTFTFDVNSDLYEELLSGEKEVILRLSFGDDSSEKISEVLINEHSFRFNTEDGEYEKDITSMVDNGANTITLRPETTFEIDNLKAFTEIA
jgi:hypothetical protein